RQHVARHERRHAPQRGLLFRAERREAVLVVLRCDQADHRDSLARQAGCNRSTVIGNDLMRRPVALYAALAIAADTPTTPISPMPLIPRGLTVSGVPTKTTSRSGTSALAGMR